MLYSPNIPSGFNLALSAISFGDRENIFVTVLETESTKFLVCSLKGLFAPFLCNAFDSKAEISVPHRKIGDLHLLAMLAIYNLCQFLLIACDHLVFCSGASSAPINTSRHRIRDEGGSQL